MEEDESFLAVVTWRDAYFDHDDAPPHDDYLVHTVGWLHDEGAWWALAQEVLPHAGGNRAVTRIPKGDTVVRIVRLDMAEVCYLAGGDGDDEAPDDVDQTATRSVAARS